MPRIPRIRIAPFLLPRLLPRQQVSFQKVSATRSYLRKVTRFRGLIDLFFRNQRQALVCMTKVSKKGDPVGPTSGRFRGRRYQFEPINRSTAISFIAISFLLRISAECKKSFLIRSVALPYLTIRCVSSRNRLDNVNKQVKDKPDSINSRNQISNVVQTVIRKYDSSTKDLSPKVLFFKNQ